MNLKPMYAGERGKTLKSYKKWKLRILKKEFLIKVSQEEEEELNSLKTEIAVDRYARKLLDNAWD